MKKNWKIKIVLGEKDGIVKIRNGDKIIERIVPTNILSEESKLKITELTQALEVNQDIWSYHCCVCNSRHYRNKNNNSYFFKHFHYAKDKKAKKSNNNGYKYTGKHYFCKICNCTHYKSMGHKENSPYEKHFAWRNK